MKQPFKIDETDRKILSAIQRDAAISHAELGQQVGTSAASCWRRIRTLEAAGVLGKVVRLVDSEAIGKSVNVLCNIRMKSHAKDVRGAFEKFVERRPEIVECFSMSGDWDYLLRIVVSDVADYNLFLMETLLGHGSVAGASSHFALSMPKYTTAIPI
jgi:Lrp/AsnC family transcriptional regulator